MSDFLRSMNELLACTQGQIPIEIANFGHFIREYDGSNFIGGVLTRMVTDQMGMVKAESITVSSILNCGHLVTSFGEIAGYCQVCGRVCCRNLGCLSVCDFTGITVCRRHFKVKYGVVVSSPAQKGFWKSKAKKLGQQKQVLLDDRKRFTENAK